MALVREMEHVRIKRELAAIHRPALLLALASVEDRVHHDVEQVIQHARNHLAQQVVRLLEARVGVDLDEDDVHQLVQNEVVA